MIKTKIEPRTVDVEITEDILCNKCGNSLKVDQVGERGIYEGLVEVEIYGGYDSKVGDMTKRKFSLCEDCLIELYKTFKILPKTEEMNGF